MCVCVRACVRVCVRGGGQKCIIEGQRNEGAYALSFETVRNSDRVSALPTEQGPSDSLGSGGSARACFSVRVSVRA